MNVRVLKKHERECSALRQVADGYWDTPWFLTDKTELRAKDGSNRAGTTTFLTAICNSMDCKATALVSRSWLERMVFLCEAE